MLRSLKNQLIIEKLKLLKIVAQSFGAEVNGRKAGTIGDFACFSFHSQKNITTLGGGCYLCEK